MNLRYASNFLGLALMSTAAMAQPSLNTTDHVPVVGQTVALRTTNGFTWDGPSGANATINYWDLFPSASGNRNTYYTPSFGTIAGAALGSTDGGTDTTFWSVTSDGLTVVGVRGSLEGVLTYTDPVVEMKLPLAFGGSWTDVGAASYVAFGFPVTRTVSLSGTADGFGVLNLPNQTSHEVLRVKVRRQVTDNSAITVVNRIANITYYFAQNSAHPIMKLTVDSTSAGMSWSVTRAVEYIGDAAVVGVEEFQDAENAFLAYPNPANERIHLDQRGAARADRVELMDAQGRIVRLEGVNTDLHVMGLNGVEPGVYTLRTWNGSTVLGTRSVVVQ